MEISKQSLAKPIKVLIVEDSPVASTLLSYIINSDPDMEVMGCVSSGEEALDFIKAVRPDVITMDIVLPGMDGYKATQQIMQVSPHPIPIIIVSANYQRDDIDKSFQAIIAGAIDILEKPFGPRDPNFQTMADALVQSIKNASAIKLMADSAAPPLSGTATTLPDFNEINLSTIQAVAMGASLGGPKALKTILSQIPAHFPAPILLVQHISAGFSQGFVHWLSQESALTFKLAEHQERTKPGTVYLAPENFHLEAGPNQTLLLTNAPPERGLRPSVALLFRSMACQYGSHGMGIILTGMGRDGAEDLLLMKKSGSITIAQDQQTALVFGMPREAIALGAADYVLSLQQIANLLISMANHEPIRLF